MTDEVRRKASGLRIVKKDDIAGANEPAEFVSVLG
jgi:hypothetical protein